MFVTASFSFASTLSTEFEPGVVLASTATRRCSSTSKRSGSWRRRRTVQAIPRQSPRPRLRLRPSLRRAASSPTDAPWSSSTSRTRPASSVQRCTVRVSPVSKRTSAQIPRPGSGAITFTPGPLEGVARGDRQQLFVLCDVLRLGVLGRRRARKDADRCRCNDSFHHQGCTVCNRCATTPEAKIRRDCAVSLDHAPSNDGARGQRVIHPREGYALVPFGDVLHRPGLLVVVQRVGGQNKARLAAGTDARERPVITLRDHRNAGLEEERRRDTDTLLEAADGDEATTLGDHLASRRRRSCR